MYRIAKIDLTNGTTMHPQNLTVAIGPNNGGKSQFLKDLVSAISAPNHPRKSISSIEPFMKEGALHVARQIITKDTKQEPNGNLIMDRLGVDLSEPQSLRLGADVLRIRENDDEDYAKNQLRTHLGSHLVAHLTTERRLLLVKRQVNKQPHIAGPQSVLHAAFDASPEVAASIANRVLHAFGKHLVLDDTEHAEIQYRLGDSPPKSKDRKQLREELKDFQELDEQGDGIRSFCGMLAAATLFKRPIIVIDEPEAFLHPPQAFLIGRALGELALTGKGVQLFVATHSADVLRGMLSANAEITIARFSQSAAGFSSHVLGLEKLREIASDPMLSSARVLDGLFYSGVAITESDGDVVLYRTVLEKLDQSASVGFINSYSKQLSGRIAASFHTAKVPCAVLVDFDMLRDPDDLRKAFVDLGGKWDAIKGEHGTFLKAIEGVEDANSRLTGALNKLQRVLGDVGKQGDASTQLSWLRIRLSEVKERATLWAKLKREGRNALPEAARAPYDHIDAQCRRVGLFITTEGDREAWLVPAIPFTKNKRFWTEQAIQYLSTKDHELPEEHPLRVYVQAFRDHCLGEMPPFIPEPITLEELDRSLDVLEGSLPQLMEDHPDEADFWPAFAGEADVIEDSASDHAAHVRQRIDRMLVSRGLIPPDDTP